MAKDISEKKKINAQIELAFLSYRQTRFVWHVCDQFWGVSYGSDDRVFSYAIIRETALYHQ